MAEASLNTDVQPWALPVGTITSGYNFRSRNDAVETVGGRQLLATYPGSDTPQWMMPVESITLFFWLVCGTQQIWKYNGAVWEEITPAGGFGTLSKDNKWTGEVVGGIPVFNPSENFCMYYSLSGIVEFMPYDATETWKDKNLRMRAIGSAKNQLIAMGLNDNSTEQPYTVQWSDYQDPGSFNWDWDYTVTTNRAGRNNLGEAGGFLVDGERLNDSFCVAKEKAIWMMDWVGGPSVWKFRRISNLAGLIATEALTEVKGQMLMMTPDDIIIHNGTEVRSLIHKRVKEAYTRNVEPTTAQHSYIVRDENNKEVWFCFPTAGSADPNIVLSWNWRDNTFGLRDLEIVNIIKSGSFLGEVRLWDQSLETWDNALYQWGERNGSPLRPTLVSLNSVSKELVIEDFGILQDESGIERLSIPVDGHKRVCHVSRLIPHMRGSGKPVAFWVGGQYHPEDTIRWESKVMFDPNVDRYVDCRTTGSLLSWRIESPAGAQWAISGMDVEYIPEGTR